MGLLVPFVHGHVESHAIETGKPEIGVTASFHSRRDAIAQVTENVVAEQFLCVIFRSTDFSLHFEINVLPLLFIKGFKYFDFNLERTRCFIRFQYFAKSLARADRFGKVR